MKTRFLSLLAFVLLFSCTREVAPIQESPVAETEEPQAIVSGEIIVKFTEDMTSLVEADLSEADVVTKSSELTFLNSELGIRSMERLFPHAGEFEERTRAEGLHRWYKVKYDKEIPLTKASDGFNALPGVEIVEPVRNIKLTSYFNDPKLKDQWHYKNDGGMDGFKAGADINVEPVWKDYTTGNSDVIVAIVDGGIDYEHEDLKDAYVGGKKALEDSLKRRGIKGSVMDNPRVSTYLVKYENDTEIYINYGVKDYESGGLTVKPGDYYRVDK